VYIFPSLQSRPTATPIERFSKGYEDYLQNPLQPLMDNLDSQTYEIFEKDPIKYVQYEKVPSYYFSLQIHVCIACSYGILYNFCIWPLHFS